MIDFDFFHFPDFLFFTLCLSINKLTKKNSGQVYLQSVCVTTWWWWSLLIAKHFHLFAGFKVLLFKFGFFGYLDQKKTGNSRECFLLVQWIERRKNKLIKTPNDDDDDDERNKFSTTKTKSIFTFFSYLKKSNFCCLWYWMW